MRKLLSLILLLALSLMLVSCRGGDYYTYCELTLPLPEEYERAASEEFDALYSDGRAFVYITRITFDAAFADGIPDTYSPLEFARFYRLNNSHTEFEINTSSHVPRYSYTGIDGEREVFMMHTFYRTPYAYFVVTYSSPASRVAEYEADFISYANGATISFFED